MVTSNIETNLDVTNGANGEIVDIILHPDELTLEDGLMVRRVRPSNGGKPPKMVVVH